MSRRWIVTALGKDRPGIVAGVTKILYRLGCNLEDSAMTRLEGEFTVMLIFSSPARRGGKGAGGPARTAEAAIQKAFDPLARQMRLSVHLKPLSAQETTPPTKRGQPYVISVYGADRPGIVYRVSELLAKDGVNITDVHTHRSAPGAGRAKDALYLLLLEVELPKRLALAALERKLHQLTKKLRVEVSVRSSEASVL